MTIRMENLESLTLAEMERFVKSSRSVKFDAGDAASRYVLIERVLTAQRYGKLRRRARGTVRRFLSKITVFSRAQLARLIARWQETREVKRRPARRPDFPRRYTTADIALLARVDAAHEDLSGPAVRHILKREFEVFRNPAYQRLAGISASHIYNLRGSAAYHKHRVRVTQTQARKVSIGDRRRPDPKGKPGFLRVDTVHQGHHDGHTGIYPINAVDTVTQWQVVGCAETISERHLLPVLEAMLHQFPFRLLGFHCDNGSEFIHHQVAELLEKLRIEFTKSRAYRTTDNALVEGKNGAVIRKQMGYGPLRSAHAEALQKFYTASFNPYLNFHRPCGYATVAVDARGRRTRTYRHQDYQTPYEKLLSLEKWPRYLKEGVSPELLQRQAHGMSDTEAAERMRKTKLALLAQGRTQPGRLE
ncbi:MAG: integrase catalytic domain-containing protein [Gammaproteobacteria bacterium]